MSNTRKKQTIFPKNLRFFRGKSTQQAVADELEINRSTYASYEEGRAEPPYWLLILISEYFEVGIDSLLQVDFEDLEEDDPAPVKESDTQNFPPLLI